MNRHRRLRAGLQRSAPVVLAGVLIAAGPAMGAPPALTIYNGGFAVVREVVPLDLRAGDNAVAFADATMLLEPDSVVLRDPTGRADLRIVEQSYRGDALSPGLLLHLYEGRTIDFIVWDRGNREHRIPGKIIRSGYTAHTVQTSFPGEVPIIEVNGRLRFGLPGEPLFPTLPDDAILRPTLSWTLAIDHAAAFAAELSYVTGGLSWEASYNLVAPEKGDDVAMTGWVTINNGCGKTFTDAALKFLAGDVKKLEPEPASFDDGVLVLSPFVVAKPPRVTEKAFDEFHLYTLSGPMTLRDQEIRQVEFLRAEGVHAKTIYIYDGGALEAQLYAGQAPGDFVQDSDNGTHSNPKVWVMREFENSEANGLGVPLPRGRMRVYRRNDADGRLEFVGENLIDHTPRNEIVRLHLGNAFDLVGERKRTDFTLSERDDYFEESYEIRLRNHKASAVEVRIVERLYEAGNRAIVEQSHDFTEADAHTVEFRVNVPAGGETVVRYRARYTAN